MTDQEKARLRALYQQWPTEKLARAATHEKSDYEPSAVTLMLEVLATRGMPAAEVTTYAASLPPPPLDEEETAPTPLLFPTRLNRQRYALRWLCWVAAMVIGRALAEAVAPFQWEATGVWVFIGVIYRIAYLDIPRLKNAGQTPWLLLFFLVPVVNFALVIFMFAIPPKDQQKRAASALRANAA